MCSCISFFFLFYSHPFFNPLKIAFVRGVKSVIPSPHGWLSQHRGAGPLPSGTDARGPSCHLYRVPGHHASAGAVLETCIGGPLPTSCV